MHICTRAFAYTKSTEKSIRIHKLKFIRKNPNFLN